MSIYLSHARKDRELALQLADKLKRQHLTVFDPESEIKPGENWAKAIGEAMQSSDFMVFLLTPGSMDADWLRQDIEFALGSRKLEGRVFSVFVGPSDAAAKDVPWILSKLPFRNVESAKRLEEVAKDIASHCAASAKS